MDASFFVACGFGAMMAAFATRLFVAIFRPLWRLRWKGGLVMSLRCTVLLAICVTSFSLHWLSGGNRFLAATSALFFLSFLISSFIEEARSYRQSKNDTLPKP